MQNTLDRPTQSGVYPVEDAVAFIKATSPEEDKQSPQCRRIGTVTSRHIYRWVRDGLAGEYLTGLRGSDVALTFLDLISLRLIAIFRAHGVTSSEILCAHRELQETRGWSHPFAMEPIWISGLNIYVQNGNIPIAITKNWQAALHFVELFVGPIHNLVFDRDAHPMTWEPEKDILLDPKVSFGEPCIKGTRIATQVLWSLAEAGDPPERLAGAYELSVNQVEAAIAWENKLTP